MPSSLACPPFLRYSLLSASHVTATNPTCSFAVASAEPAPPNSHRTLTTSQSESRRRCVLAKRMCDCLEPCDVKPTSRRGHGASRSAGCGGKALHIESNTTRNSPMGRAVLVTRPSFQRQAKIDPTRSSICSRVSRGRALAVVESPP